MQKSNDSKQLLPSADLIWQQPEVIRKSQRLLRLKKTEPALTVGQILTQSYQKLLGRELIASIHAQELAEALFKAPFALVSHGIEPDPILNYGNQTALNLWSMSWSEFTQTPSRLTAEPVNRATRASMLEQVAKQGYIDNYQGIRISSRGKRFAIERAIIWNLTDELGQNCGQAATFSYWKWLES